MSNLLQAVIAFLSAADPLTIFTGPEDLGDGAVESPRCVVDLSPAPSGPVPPGQRIGGYTLRFYGPDDIAALDAHERAKRATDYPLAVGLPRTYVPTGDRTLIWLRVSEATGPMPEPDTGRPVVAATATAKWI